MVSRTHEASDPISSHVELCASFFFSSKGGVTRSPSPRDKTCRVSCPIRQVLDVKDMVVSEMLRDRSLMVALFQRCGKAEFSFLVNRCAGGCKPLPHGSPRGFGGRNSTLRRGERRADSPGPFSSGTRWSSESQSGDASSSGTTPGEYVWFQATRCPPGGGSCRVCHILSRRCARRTFLALIGGEDCHVGVYGVLPHSRHRLGPLEFEVWVL